MGTICVKDNWAVQSFGYSQYLPVGNPVTLAVTLSRWGIDEIFVACIDRSVNALGPNLDLIESLSRASVRVPVTYAGGIDNAAKATSAIRAGADRIALDVCLRHRPEAAWSIAESLGVQAVVGVFPLVVPRGQQIPQVFNYQRKLTEDLREHLDFWVQDPPFSEALVVDVAHEGSLTGFRSEFLAEFSSRRIPTLALGGIATVEHIEQVFLGDDVTAVCIENSIFYRELASHQLRRAPVGWPPLSPSSSWRFD